MLKCPLLKKFGQWTTMGQRPGLRCMLSHNRVRQLSDNIIYTVARTRAAVYALTQQGETTF